MTSIDTRLLAQKVAKLLVQAEVTGSRDVDKVLELARSIVGHHREYGDGVRIEREFRRDAQV